jgi:hypothetical protein
MHTGFYLGDERISGAENCSLVAKHSGNSHVWNPQIYSPGLYFQNTMPQAGHKWLKPVILATQEAEIRRITVQSQPGQTDHETLSQKKKKSQKVKSQILCQICLDWIILLHLPCAPLSKICRCYRQLILRRSRDLFFRWNTIWCRSISECSTHERFPTAGWTCLLLGSLYTC